MFAHVKYNKFNVAKTIYFISFYLFHVRCENGITTIYTTTKSLLSNKQQ